MLRHHDNPFSPSHLTWPPILETSHTPRPVPASCGSSANTLLLMQAMASLSARAPSRVWHTGSQTPFAKSQRHSRMRRVIIPNPPQPHIKSPKQASIVKLQLLSLAAKVQVLVPDMPSALQLLVRHVFDLARYDENYDVRDRARMLSSLSIGISSSKPLSGELDDNESEDAATRTGVILRREQVKLVLFEGKTSSNIRKPSYSK